VLAKRCRLKGIQILGASMEGAVFWELNLARPTLFVLGSEGAGLPTGVLDQLDARVAIPMASQVESLNVAMCATLLLYESLRQQFSVGNGALRNRNPRDQQ
jgi:TrmH family RNA methyltransferase